MMPSLPLYARGTKTSLLRELQRGNTAIPAGDRGEQLIANLILSIIACHLHTVESARAYITQAHAIAEGLSRETLTHRPRRLSKLARLVCEADGQRDNLLLSIINDILVIPVVNPQDAARHARDKSSAQLAINLSQVEVAYFMLRLRTSRLVGALQPLRKMTSGEELAVAAEGILTECLHHEITSVPPLDVANDCFMLARNFIGLTTFPLATLALKKADNALQLYMKTTPVTEHPAVVQKMKEQIAAITEKLRNGPAS